MCESGIAVGWQANRMNPSEDRSQKNIPLSPGQGDEAETAPQELPPPFSRRLLEHDRGEVPGLEEWLLALLAHPSPQLRDSAGLKPDFPHCAPRFRAAGAPLPGTY